MFAQKLAQIQGVGQVQVSGSSLPAVRVEVNPQPVSRYNVGLDQIGSFLQGANANKPKGSLDNGVTTTPLIVSDQLLEAKDYRNLIVVYRNGAPVRLSDLGRVIDSVEDVRNLGLADGKPAVLIQVRRQPNANVVDTVRRIKDMLPRFKASLPPTVDFKVENDRTITIRDSVRDAQRNMVISIGLVILVVFIFLRNGWATFIPSVSVPVSLIATFGAMYLLGYNLDNLSLMGLTIATGFVVDDAIVVIENITRHIENGMPAMRAALKGAEEIGFTVLSMSISLIAVFIPILMMPGIIGRLFREFAIVLSVAIAVSLAISLTATPMMCSRLLKVKHVHGRMYNWTEKFFQWVISTYASALQAVLGHPAPVLLVMLVTVGISGYLYVKIPKGFFPQQDTGRLQGQVQGQQHISYQSLVEKAKWFEEQVRTDPDVDTVGVTAGGNGGGWGGASSAQIFVQLKSKRNTTPDQVIARIRQKTSGMPGATCICSLSRTFGSAAARATRNTNTRCRRRISTCCQVGTEGSDKLSTLPELVDVSSDQQNSGLSSNVIIDRDTASRLGLTAQAVDSALYDAFGQRQVLDDVQIDQPVPCGAGARTAVVGESRLPPENLRTDAPGLSVPLSAFAHFAQGITPLSLSHQGQFPASTISFNLPEGVSLSDAVLADQQGRAADGTADEYHRAISPAPRRRFRTRCPVSPS